MTASELRNINREIKRLKSKLVVLDSNATKTTSSLSFAPGGSSVSDKVGEITTQMVHIKKQIQELEIIQNTEIKRLSTEIFQENCLFMHFGLHYSWTKIAMKIGGNNSADSIRKACERYKW